MHPAAEPVIGPQLEAARERLRLTVDQLSERTRIRPHVIEAIEVDDFGPCGGDFYARGHLRTLARVLGIDAGPLVASYDETYAAAPVDPRRVFEAELATGVGGSIRGTRGGRNWSVLIAAVMAAILIWSIARLVMDGPLPLDKPSTLRQTGSNGIGAGAKAEEVPVTLTATAGGARVIVRDGSGAVKYDGPLAFGQTAKVNVDPAGPHLDLRRLGHRRRRLQGPAAPRRDRRRGLEVPPRLLEPRIGASTPSSRPRLERVLIRPFDSRGISRRFGEAAILANSHDHH